MYNYLEKIIQFFVIYVDTLSTYAIIELLTNQPKVKTMTKNTYQIKNHKEYKSVKNNIKEYQEYKRHNTRYLQSLKEDLNNPEYANVKSIIEKDIKFYEIRLQGNREWLTNANNLVKQYELNNQ